MINLFSFRISSTPVGRAFILFVSATSYWGERDNGRMVYGNGASYPQKEAEERPGKLLMENANASGIYSPSFSCLNGDFSTTLWPANSLAGALPPLPHNGEGGLTCEIQCSLCRPGPT